MGGLGVFAWLAIGAAAGWTISRLMVDASDDALRGTAAGMIGAVLGGLGMRLLEASSPAGPGELNAFTAALAGSLWLSWTTCVVTSGRRPGATPRVPEGHVAAPDAVVRSAGARPAIGYAAARNQLVDLLLRDAMAHDAERYDEIGRRFDGVERVLPQGGGPELGKIRVAVAFWDGWIDARNRGWHPEAGIAKSDWPELARSVAADLEGDREVTDVRVVAHFDIGLHPALGSRVHTLAARMRAS